MLTIYLAKELEICQKNLLGSSPPLIKENNSRFTNKLRRKILPAHNSVDSIGHVTEFPNYFLTRPLENRQKLMLPVVNRIICLVKMLCQTHQHDAISLRHVLNSWLRTLQLIFLIHFTLENFISPITTLLIPISLVPERAKQTRWLLPF